MLSEIFLRGNVGRTTLTFIRVNHVESKPTIFRCLQARDLVVQLASYGLVQNFLSLFQSGRIIKLSANRVY